MFIQLIKSFKYAIRGICLCIKNERNFRVHIIALFSVVVFALVYGLPKENYIFLLLIFGLVLFAELINSAMEALVNINSSHYNYFARNAKDIAAGAVLITAIFSVVIAVILFSDLEKLYKAICIVFCSPINTIALLFWISISYIFIKGVKK